MTFSYDPSLGDDESIVRFHIGDTVEEGAYLPDETITALIASEGTNEDAAIACLRYILTQLSTPNFRKDWLQVDYQTAREGFEKILEDKSAEFGINLGAIATATVALPTRADSYQDADEYDYDGSP